MQNTAKLHTLYQGSLLMQQKGLLTFHHLLETYSIFYQKMIETINLLYF